MDEKDNPYAIKAAEQTIGRAKNETAEGESSSFNNVRQLSKGTNKGKFSQLLGKNHPMRYMLKNPDRVQTSDNVFQRNQQEF